MRVLRTLRGAARRLIYGERVRVLASRYLSRWWTVETERVWSQRAGPPEWYDHRSHLLTFGDDRNPLWAERGVYSREPMFDGCRVLDLCCGDGFYSFHFFADRAAHIDAVDFDQGAITHARRHHALPNITHGLLDVRSNGLPSDHYDVVVWDGAIEHFTLEEIDAILGRCAKALGSEGVLTGYTMRREESGAQHPEHEHEFEDANEVRALLQRTFPEVAILENTTGGRRNLYFRAGFNRARLNGFR